MSLAQRWLHHHHHHFSVVQLELLLLSFNVAITFTLTLNELKLYKMRKGSIIRQLNVNMNLSEGRRNVAACDLLRPHPDAKMSMWGCQRNRLAGFYRRCGSGQNYKRRRSGGNRSVLTVCLQ